METKINGGLAKAKTHVDQASGTKEEESGEVARDSDRNNFHAAAITSSSSFLHRFAANIITIEHQVVGTRTVYREDSEATDRWNASTRPGSLAESRR